MNQAPVNAEKGILLPAIVVGLCAHGMHIVRNLSRHGIEVIAIESNFEQPTAKTKYGKKVKCDNINSESLIDCLLNIFDQHGVPLPVFLTNDKMLENIDAHWGRVKGKFIFPFERSHLKPLMDKNSLHRIAVDYGFKLPRSFTLESVEGLEELPEDLQYPVILKPTIPMGSFKTLICENPIKVAEKLQLCVGEPLVLQEWIPGEEQHLYFCGYYIDRNLVCKTQFSGRKYLCYPDITGNTGAAEPFYYPHLLKQGLEFFQSLGVHGLCSIEYKGLNANSPYFIEVTIGRTDWWAMCSTVNGANPHIAAYNDMTFQNISYESKPSCKFLWNISDRALPVVRDKLKNRAWGIRDLLIYLFRPKKFAIFDIHDLSPFFYSTKCLFVNMFKK